MEGLIPWFIPIPRQIERALRIKASPKASNKETLPKGMNSN